MAISIASALYEGTNIIDSGLDQIVIYSIINNNTWINSTQVSNTSIQITIPELSSNLSFSIIFQGYKNEQEKVIYISSGGSSSGNSVSYIYKNITKEVPVEKVIYLEKNNTITIEKNNEVNMNLKWFWITIVILSILLLVSIIWLIKEKTSYEIIESNEFKTI